MSIHTEADYSHLLATYKEPVQGGMKVPFALWGRIAAQNASKGEEPRPDLTELLLIGSHRHSEKSSYYGNVFGWKLLKYWTPQDNEWAETRGTLEALLKASNSDQLLKELEAERARNQVLEQRVKEKSK